MFNFASVQSMMFAIERELSTRNNLNPEYRKELETAFADLAKILIRL